MGRMAISNRHLALAALVGAALLALALGAFVAMAGTSETFAVLLPATVVGVIAVGTLRQLHRDSADALSPLGLTCLFYLMTFSLGAAYAALADDYFIWWIYSVDGMVTAMWLGAFGLVSLIVGYRANLLVLVTTWIPNLPRVRSDRAAAVVIALAAIGWLARSQQFLTGSYFYNDSTREALSASSGIVGVLGLLPVVAMAYFGARYYMAKRDGVRLRAMQWGFYALIAVEVAYNAPRGARAPFLSLLMAIVVLRYYGLRRRPPAALIALFVALSVLVIFPVLFALRNADDSGRYQDNLAGSMTTAVASVFEKSPSNAVEVGITATLERFSGATSISAIIDCPCPSPRAPGETVAWTVTSVLPRAVYPDKPTPALFGNEFGRYYDISYDSGIAMTQVGEMFMNFGWFGVGIGMLFVGAIYRWMSDFLRRRTSDPLTLAIYATLAWTIINMQETIVASGLLSALKTLLVLTLLLFGIMAIRPGVRSVDETR